MSTPLFHIWPVLRCSWRLKALYSCVKSDLHIPSCSFTQTEMTSDVSLSNCRRVFVTYVSPLHLYRNTAALTSEIAANGLTFDRWQKNVVVSFLFDFSCHYESPTVLLSLIHPDVDSCCSSDVLTPTWDQSSGLGIVQCVIMILWLIRDFICN